MTPQELLAKLNRDIPVSKFLGFEFVEATPNRVEIRARLNENINHKGTAFGGSLYTLSVLAAYSLVYLGVECEKIKTNNLVIQKGDIQYMKPVTSDFDIICEFNGVEAYQKFYEDLARWKKVREVIKVRVYCQGVLCAKLDGVFVVQL
ncbi:MAG: YiiD C-terminal domain-containing protein [Bdellovibrionaceae bacterium]|nr:YiiD C-terminal domain-containing protein [Pseudobdellovibrionaceae bacterium]